MEPDSRKFDDCVHEAGKEAERTPTMLQIENPTKNKKTANLASLSICNNHMVRLLDYRWNHFLPDLYLIHTKLEKFGLAYINKKVVYLGDEELGNV